MSWKQIRELPRTLTFRVGLWYAALFLVSALLLLVLVYFLLGAAIDRKDRDMIEARLHEYVSVYQHGGLPALREWSERINRLRGQREYFVQVDRAGQAPALQIVPGDWSERDLRSAQASAAGAEQGWRRLARDSEVDLTVATSTLPDGERFLIGRSSDSRAKLLANFRQTFALVLLPLVLLGMVGGMLFTNRLTQPVRGVLAAASSIIDTGRLDVRVPIRPANDELRDLAVLFNRMLDHNEALFRALRDSLDNVAHDLRTPLARLRATLEEALAEDGHVEALHDRIGSALEETERVQTIIRTLMDVSQAEAGLMRLQRAPTEISRLIDDAVALYAHVAEEKGIDLTTDLAGGCEALVDAPRVRQVFANLLDNAIKYTPAGGVVSVAADCSAGEVRVRLRDTGQGIEPADLPRIWERLYRGDKSRGQPGLGLGLNLVKAIVEAHRGRVEVRSRLGEGSEFSVYLPVRHEAA